MAELFISHRPVPVRFYLEAGLGEETLLRSARTFRDVLRAKGYRIDYHEFVGGHDYSCWRGTLSDGLMFLTDSKAAERK